MDYNQKARYKNHAVDKGICGTCKKYTDGCQASCDGEYGKMFAVEECSQYKIDYARVER